ncbi:Rv3235 family protein [Streptomyces sp. NPDC004435]|uniref:Rv3235 family protein n=1 Tax=Streptomyces sp. NPDC004435 TaxID=3364701 RepID=UPI00369F32C8
MRHATENPTAPRPTPPGTSTHPTTATHPALSPAPRTGAPGPTAPTLHPAPPSAGTRPRPGTATATRPDPAQAPQAGTPGPTAPAAAGRPAVCAPRHQGGPGRPGGPADAPGGRPRPLVPPQGTAGRRAGCTRTGAGTAAGAARRTLPVHTAFAERLLAVLSGDRPVHSMLGLTVGEAYEQLVRLAPRTAARGPGPRPVLRRCAAQPHSGDTVLEVFASLAAGHRVRALAFRLERGPDHRWRCAAVELDGLGRLVGGAAQP